MGNNFYSLVMFPYPSGDGLHVGHYYNYAIMDSYNRWQIHKGKQVFQPFGYDAFGLPAENYAKKHNRDPREVTYENINKFRIQLDKMHTNYEELIITSDVSYQKWTQWLFTKLKEHDMAYKKVAPVNYCPSCETVLANEQVIHKSINPVHQNDDRGRCERCGTNVDVKELNQWFFRISKYKDRLIKNLDWIDYPEKTIKQQRYWLADQQDWCVSRQRKWGCPIPIEGEEDTLDTFVDSSFYYLRYLDPHNENELVSKDKVKQVDLYVGGNEHACMHLVYARFINMFLYDIGVTPFEEPFKKLIHQGMITYNGEKMSKSKGNVINPDDYDPDELRMYLMFIGHYFDGGSWDDGKIIGIRKFIGRMSRWLASSSDDGVRIDVDKLNNTIDGYVEAFKFNKVVSTLMEFYNSHKNIIPNKESANQLIVILKCFVPQFNSEK